MEVAARNITPFSVGMNEIPEQAALRRLGDAELVQGLLLAHAAEARVTLRVVMHLIEMERRGIHLEQGFGSLFDYCTGKLGYSASAATRRIKAARCIRDYPEVYWQLKDGRVNLSTIAQVAGILDSQNAGGVLERIAGKSQREVAAIVAEYRPEASLPERVRPVCLKSPDGAMEFIRRIKMEFGVSPEVWEKFEMVKLLLSNKYPEGVTLEEAFGEILEEYYDRHAPERRQARRAKRSEQAAAKITDESSRVRSGCKDGDDAPAQHVTEQCTGQVAVKAAEGGESLEKNTEVARTRHIPQQTRDEVYLRDAGRCTYVGKDGRRCKSRWNPEYDHINSFAAGAGHEAHELRMLCWHHNQLEAKKMYGSTFIEHAKRRDRCGRATS